ncbi:MAG: type IV secretory system conjugative DNA transfer family protein [Actinomycetota bacterium]|nr:type IV secretory system conjugative DNA transfer family protein [Actinomycetota bacterium]
MSIPGWGPQPPPPPSRKRRSPAKGCLFVIVGWNVVFYVVLGLVMAVRWTGTHTVNPNVSALLGWVVILAPPVMVVRRIRRRRRRRQTAAHGDPKLLPQRIAASRDPIAAVQAEALRAGGGSFIGFVGEGNWVGADPQHALLVLGPPRSGKTTSIIIPTLLSMSGPVVSTATKPEVLAATASVRRRLGTVWLFDPTGTEELPAGVQALRWSPVRAARRWDGALVMARAMVAASPATTGNHNDTHWSERAAALVAPLLHAASLDARPVTDVVRWVLRNDLDEPGAILEDHDAEIATDVLVGIAQTHEKERSGIFSTAANVLGAYNAEGARRAAAEPNFDPEVFVRSADTVYITAAAHLQDLAAPLVVGLLEEIRHATYARARQASLAGTNPGPPVVFALDECANIAPIHDLPALVSEAGGQGLHVLACFQDLSQVRRRWGDATADGFLSLFVNKAILANIADSRTLESLSLAFGEYDRQVSSYSQQDQRFMPEGSTSWSLQRQRVLTPGDIANLPEGRVLFVRGVRWALVQMTPWYAINPWPAVWAAASRGEVRVS